MTKVHMCMHTLSHIHVCWPQDPTVYQVLGLGPSYSSGNLFFQVPHMGNRVLTWYALLLNLIMFSIPLMQKPLQSSLQGSLVTSIVSQWWISQSGSLRLSPETAVGGANAQYAFLTGLWDLPYHCTSGSTAGFAGSCFWQKCLDQLCPLVKTT